MNFKHFIFGTLLAGLVAGCGPASGPDTTQSAPPPSAPRIEMPVKRTDDRSRHYAFLQKIRQADPQFKTIDRAILNEQNELGLVLDRTVEMSSVPALMKTVLIQMAKEFPNQDLTVIAYAPSNPPLKIGTAHLNAGTRDMTYTAAAQR